MINKEGALDLHVLGTPPAFILSQDQTLHKIYELFKLIDLIQNDVDSTQLNFQSYLRLKPMETSYITHSHLRVDE